MEKSSGKTGRTLKFYSSENENIYQIGHAQGGGWCAQLPKWPLAGK